MPSCNANSGQMDLHHDDPELQDPAVPPDPCPASSGHHTSCGLSSCFHGLCATRFCRLFCPPRYISIRADTWILPSHLLYFCHILNRTMASSTQGPPWQPAHPLPHHPLRLPRRQNHAWTHCWPWRNRFCASRSHLVCSYRCVSNSSFLHFTHPRWLPCQAAGGSA